MGFAEDTDAFLAALAAVLVKLGLIYGVPW